MLVAIDGQPIRGLRDYLRIQQDKRPRVEAEFEFYRGGTRMTRRVELVGRDSGTRFRF